MLRQLLLLWLLSVGSYVNHVHWLGSYDKALELALKAHKPLLVLVVKKDSKASKTILHKHFMNHPYIDSINKQMIAVIVTYEGQLSYPSEMYYTTVFPTLFLVDTKTETFISEPLYEEEIDSNSLSEMVKNRRVLYPYNTF